MTRSTTVPGAHPRTGRRRRSAALAVLAAVALGACGAPTPEDEVGAVLPAADQLAEPTGPVTVDYVGAAYGAEDLEPVFAAFEQAHPTITVNYESVPFDDLNSVLDARLGQGDTGIELLDVDMPRMAAYVDRGYVAELTPTFGDISGEVDPSSLEASTVDGRLMAMPLQTSSQLLYYNKALLAAAGIPAPGPDTRPTWEQVAADAARAQAAGAKWGLVFDQLDRYYQLQPLPESLGGGSGATGPRNLEPVVNNAEWKQALDFYGGLYADGVSPRGITAAETAQLFAAGEAAYFVSGPWQAPTFLEDPALDFGVTRHPAFEGGEAVTPTGAWSLGLNPNGEELEAALLLMRFMALEGGGFTQYVDTIAIPPANTEGAQRYYEQDTFTAPQMQGAAEILQSEIAETARVRVQTVGFIEFEDIMTRAFSDIINGAPAAETLDRANEDLVAAWRKYR